MGNFFFTLFGTLFLHIFILSRYLNMIWFHRELLTDPNKGMTNTEISFLDTFWDFLGHFFTHFSLEALSYYDLVSQRTVDWSQRGNDRHGDKAWETSQKSESKLFNLSKLQIKSTKHKEWMIRIRIKTPSRSCHRKRRRIREWSWATIIRTKSFSGFDM